MSSAAISAEELRETLRKPISDCEPVWLLRPPAPAPEPGARYTVWRRGDRWAVIDEHGGYTQAETADQANAIAIARRLNDR